MKMDMTFKDICQTIDELQDKFRYYLGEKILVLENLENGWILCERENGKKTKQHHSDLLETPFGK